MPTCTTGRRVSGPRASPAQAWPPAPWSMEHRGATSLASQTAVTWRRLVTSAGASSHHHPRSASVAWTVHVTVSSRTLVRSSDASPAGVGGRSGTGTSSWVLRTGEGTVRTCSKRRPVPRGRSARSTDTRTSSTALDRGPTVRPSTAGISCPVVASGLFSVNVEGRWTVSTSVDRSSTRGS